MPGKVVRLLAAEGSAVEAGQSVIVIEAMKMQNELKAPKTGVVKKINVSEGTAVEAGQSLAEGEGRLFGSRALQGMLGGVVVGFGGIAQFFVINGLEDLLPLAAPFAADELLHLRIIQFPLPGEVLAVQANDLVAVLLVGLGVDGRQDVSVLSRLELLHGIARGSVKVLYLRFRDRLYRAPGASGIGVFRILLRQIGVFLATVQAVVDHLDLPLGRGVKLGLVRGTPW